MWWCWSFSTFPQVHELNYAVKCHFLVEGIAWFWEDILLCRVKPIAHSITVFSSSTKMTCMPLLLPLSVHFHTWSLTLFVADYFLLRCKATDFCFFALLNHLKSSILVGNASRFGDHRWWKRTVILKGFVFLLMTLWRSLEKICRHL